MSCGYIYVINASKLHFVLIPHFILFDFCHQVISVSLDGGYNN